MDRPKSKVPLFSTRHRSLTMEDQISLLKGAAVEILHISLNTTFCLQTENFFCGPLCYKMEDAVHGEMVERSRVCISVV
jgi:hypothetical protein